MKKIGISIAAGILLAACGGSDSGTIETEDGTLKYDVESDGGNAEMRFSDGEGGEVVVNSSDDASAASDYGFSIYPGSEVGSSTVVDNGGDKGAMITMISSATPQEMVNHYRQQAEAAGIEIQMEMNSNDTMMIGGEGPDGQTFSFNASPSDGKTIGMLIVGSKVGN